MNKLIEYLKNSLEKVKSTDWKNLLKQKSKDPIFCIRFSGYVIPFIFLLYLLNINYHPFGYSKTFIINVGNKNDTNVSEFYLEPSKNLSVAKKTQSNIEYRELNGSAFAIFKPHDILNSANIKVSVTGHGVYLVPPIVKFDLSTIDWDYSWDFSNTDTLKIFSGNAFNFDNAIFFDGNSRLEFLNSVDKFEQGPFSVYIEWKPTDSIGYGQQIIGHFNWELFQNNNSVTFTIGRMSNISGSFYTIKYPIDQNFFNNKHSAIIIYSPSKNGYMEMYIDNNFIGRTYFNTETIWKDYGKDNLSIGWSKNYNYGKNAKFTGFIYLAKIASLNIFEPKSSIEFKIKDNNKINIPIISNATSTINQIILEITQK